MSCKSGLTILVCRIIVRRWHIHTTSLLLKAPMRLFCDVRSQVGCGTSSHEIVTELPIYVQDIARVCLTSMINDNAVGCKSNADDPRSGHSENALHTFLRRKKILPCVQLLCFLARFSFQTLLNKQGGNSLSDLWHQVIDGPYNNFMLRVKHF